MEVSQQSDGMNAEELKSRLFQTMQSSGVLRKLKGQLRQTMINELRGKIGQGQNQKELHQSFDLLTKTIKHRKSYSWIQQAIDNLVFLHLKQNRYQYSLSLFQQESSINSYNQSLTDDLMERLGLRTSDVDITLETPGSSLSEEAPLTTSTPTRSSNDGLTLWRILDKLSAVAAHTPINETVKITPQAEKTLTLGERLRAIDEEVDYKSSGRPRDPVGVVSAYTAAVRNAEEAADRRSKLAFEQWKAFELSRMKLEESQKSKATIDKKLKDLEHDYQLKRDALQNRESAAVSRLNYQRELLEREMHEKRQNLLSEIEQMRSREDALHKKEQFIHEMEITKQRTLGILQEQLQQSEQSLPAERQPPRDNISHSPRSYPTNMATDDMQTVKRHLEQKSVEIDQLRAEISSLKVELSAARSNRQDQAERENLILKSHLEQLTREIHGYRAHRSETPRNIAVEDKLREEIKVLKMENLEQDAQRRQLAETLKQMQRALEESNTALSHLNSQSKVLNTVAKDSPVNLGQIISNYSTPTKRDQLRDYEPLETGSNRLHPALASSGEFDDPCMDSKIARAGVGLDVQYRLKNLESESDELNEQYQRYLSTNYKDLMEAQAKSRTKKGSLQRPFQPSPRSPRIKTGESESRERPKTFHPESKTPRAHQRQLQSFSRSPRAKTEEYESRLQPKASPKSKSRTSPRREHVRKQDKPAEISSTTLQRKSIENLPSQVRSVVIATEALELDSGRKHSEDVERLGDAGSPTFEHHELKLSVDSLEQFVVEDPPSSIKTSSEESSSPKVDTVRRINGTEDPPPDKDISHPIPRQPLPVASVRKLPSLPPIQQSHHLSSLAKPVLHDPKDPKIISDPENDYDLPKESEERNQASLIDERKSDENLFSLASPPVDFTHSNSSNFFDEENKNVNPVVLHGDVEVDDIGSNKNFTQEKVVYEHPLSNTDDHSAMMKDEREEKRVEDDDPGEMRKRGKDRSGKDEPGEFSMSVSSVSEDIAASFSTSTDDKFQLQWKPSEENREKSPTKESESISGRKNPLADVDKAQTYSPEFASETESNPEKPKKNFSDLNYSDEEDISAALRWGEENKPTLDFDEEEMPMKKSASPQLETKDDPLKEEVDVFEMSDHQFSMDSSAGKAGLHGSTSDDSW